MRYLDIDTILSEEERMPCTFKYEGAHLGFLDPNNQESENILEDSRVVLPLWLAQPLMNKSMIDVEVPKHFGPKMRDEIRAGATSINLREFSFYFFEVGLILSSILRDADLGRSLRIAFCGERFNNLFTRCMTGGHQDSTEFFQTLTSTEQSAFTKGRASYESYIQWKSSQTLLLKPSLTVEKRMREQDISTDTNDKRTKKY